jgi:peptidoglycan-N-acetylglucosamine deacetylase
LGRTGGASANLLIPEGGHASASVARRRSVSKASFSNFHRVYRLRRILRWALLALMMLSLFSVGALIYGTASSKPTHRESVSLVEAGHPLAPPAPPPLDMDKVWTAAQAQDLSPDLAAPGEPASSGHKVALTFDDGPDPHTTPLILDALRKHDVKATFFVVGRSVAQHPRLLRRIVEEGHALGNHTYNHFDMAYLRPLQMRQELLRTQEAVDEALGYHYPMVLMRPPYGEPYFNNPGMLPAFQRVVRGQELFVVMWTDDSRDWLLTDRPERVVQNVVRDKVSKGRGRTDRVILLHDAHQQTVDALPQIIDHYEESGAQFTDVNELLASKYPSEQSSD